MRAQRFGWHACTADGRLSKAAARERRTQARLSMVSMVSMEGAHDTMGDSLDPHAQKPRILGQPHALGDEEARGITEMILQAQGSARQLTIPAEDLDAQATTEMSPAAAQVINESHVRDILNRFNRDYLYGLGRFDEYEHGMLLKWGDGYSRKHIWLTVEGDNLVFETSHERRCSRPYCRGGHHVFAPEQWHDVRLINQELAEQFQRPVYERSED